jgi:hypothetical protein
VIRFEPLAVRDLPLLRERLERDHVRRWWRDPIEDEKVGFRPVREVEEDGVPHRLLRLDRPARVA